MCHLQGSTENTVSGFAPPKGTESKKLSLGWQRVSNVVCVLQHMTCKARLGDPGLFVWGKYKEA